MVVLRNQNLRNGVVELSALLRGDVPVGGVLHHGAGPLLEDVEAALLGSELEQLHEDGGLEAGFRRVEGVEQVGDLVGHAQLGGVDNEVHELDEKLLALVEVLVAAHVEDGQQIEHEALDSPLGLLGAHGQFLNHGFHAVEGGEQAQGTLLGDDLLDLGVEVAELLLVGVLAPDEGGLLRLLAGLFGLLLLLEGEGELLLVEFGVMGELLLWGVLEGDEVHVD